MNKRGFTLIELLAVVSIIAILLVITVPAILNTREVATASLGEQEKQALLEAGQMIGIDLDDYSMPDVKCDNGWITCTMENDKWKTAKVELFYLKEYNYFTDDSNHCKSNDDDEAYVTVTKVNSGYKVEISNNLVCNNY